jgi:hypothetical protein
MIEDTDYIISRLEEEAVSLPSQKNRCLQHLVELGYIPLTRLNALRGNDLERAKIHFFEDARESGLYTEDELIRKIFEEEEEFLAELLGKAVDVDEGFRFDALPDNGSVNLLSRIIHYRLDLFGMWPFAIDTPFSAVNTIATLNTLGEYAGCNALEAINHLADIEGLTKRLLDIHPEEDFILTFKSRNPVDRKLERELERTVKFRKQLLDDFGERSEFFKYLNRHVLPERARKVDFSWLDRESLNPFKRFVLRLIQVHQWQDGLYDGLLDSDIGELTIRSILDAIDLFNQAGLKRIETFRVLTHLVNGYFLFNGLFFLQEYMIEEEAGVNAEDTIVNDVLDSINRSDEKSMNAFEANLELLKLEIAVASKNEPEEKKGFLKRIYFGVKKFFKKLVSISKKIFRWIADLTKKFWGLLKKVFGHFFGKLAKGIKAFVDGIKFLLGKKSTTTFNDSSLISSVIRMDGDCYNIVAGDAREVAPEHTRKIKYNVTSMEFALSIVGGVINIVIKAFNMLSWPMLIFSIVKIFKNISESYQKLELITT